MKKIVSFLLLFSMIFLMLQPGSFAQSSYSTEDSYSVNLESYIGKKWAKMYNRSPESIGMPISNEYTYFSGSYQEFEHGVIVYSNAYGAVHINSSHHDVLLNLGTDLAYPIHIPLQNYLGFPIEDTEFKDNMFVSKFERGAIVEKNPNQPKVIYGEIYDTWEKLDRLPGAPISMSNTINDNYRVQQFENGDIYQRYRDRSYYVHGEIRDKWLSLGGYSGELGYPISNEMGRDINGVSARMMEFEGGVIYHSPSGTFILDIETNNKLNNQYSWLGFPISSEITKDNGIQYTDFQNGVLVKYTDGNYYAFNKLEFFVERVDSEPGDIFEGNRELVTHLNISTNVVDVSYYKRFPDGDEEYDGGSDVNHSIEMEPIVNGNYTFNISFQGNDIDPVEHDEMGLIEKEYSIDNLWGYFDDPYNEDDKFYATFRVRNPIPFEDDPDKFRETYFWKFRNFSTDSLSYELYASTFKDVDRNDNWLFDPWKKSYYHIFYKDVASSGNCFGICTEALYAREGLSMYSQPINQYFPDIWVGSQLDESLDHHKGLMREINIKHGYQIGTDVIKWQIGQTLLSKNNPISVYNDTENKHKRGSQSIITIYEPGGHAVVPYKWEKVSDEEWRIYVADCNNPSGPSFISREDYIVINPNENEFTYKDYKSISYIPYSLISDQPHTPFDIFMAAVTAVTVTLILLGDTGSLDEVRDEQGNILYHKDNEQSNSGFMSIPIMNENEDGPGFFYAEGDEIMNYTYKTSLKPTAVEGSTYEWVYSSQTISAIARIPGYHGKEDTITVNNRTDGNSTFSIKTNDSGVEKEVELVLSGGDKYKYAQLSNLSLAPGQTVFVEPKNGGLELELATDGPVTTADLTVQTGEDSTPVYYGKITIGSEESVVEFDVPKTTITLNGDQDSDGWYKNYPEVTFTSKDYSGKGIDYIEYSYSEGDNKEWIRYNSPYIHTIEGISNIYFRAMDKDGNLEPIQSFEIKTDSRPDAFTFDELNWTAKNATLSLDYDMSTDGASSMKITGEGWMELYSPYFYSQELPYVSSQVEFDLYIPSPPTNPYWLGDISLVYKNPRLNIHCFIGYVSMQDMNLGQWNTITFDLPEHVRNAILDNKGASHFQINLNADMNEKSFRIDNLRFAGGASRVLNDHFTIVPEEEQLEVLMNFENIQDWSSNREIMSVTDSVYGGENNIAVSASGWTVVKSRMFNSRGFIETGNQLELELYIPSPLPNPYWTGEVGIEIISRSDSVTNYDIGRVQLNGLNTDQFNILTFNLDSQTKEHLENGMDCEINVIINVPDQNGQFILRRLEFKN